MLSAFSLTGSAFVLNFTKFSIMVSTFSLTWYCLVWTFKKNYLYVVLHFLLLGVLYFCILESSSLCCLHFSLPDIVLIEHFRKFVVMLATYSHSWHFLQLAGYLRWPSQLWTNFYWLYQLCLFGKYVLGMLKAICSLSRSF